MRSRIGHNTGCQRPIRRPKKDLPSLSVAAFAEQTPTLCTEILDLGWHVVDRIFVCGGLRRTGKRQSDQCSASDRNDSEFVSSQKQYSWNSSGNTREELYKILPPAHQFIGLLESRSAIHRTLPAFLIKRACAARS
jgi:hypothetical protein